MSRLIACTLILLLTAASGAVLAESSQSFGGYTVHYNAFTSDTLQPAMAKAYNITRSKSRALLTISVLRPGLSPVGAPVRAQISATATNLTGQLRGIDLRMVDEGGSIYYLSEFSVANEEVLNFTLQVTPEGEDKTFEIRFRRQFYTQ